MMKQVIFADKKIFYRAEGRGKVVMLVHGFAENNNIWNHQLEKLKEKFYVILPDLPGSGVSQMLEGEITIDDYSEVLKAIADQELKMIGEKSFTLIGHSMGGYITLAFAEKYGQLLNGFGLFHSSAYADDAAKKDLRRKGIEFIRQNGAAAFLRFSTPNLFSKKTKKEQPNLINELLELSRDFSPETLIQYYEAMTKRPERLAVLATFPFPVLFIIGKADNAIPLDTSLRQCHLPSISSIHILEDSAHMGMWEQQEHSLDYLEEFLLMVS
jgi:pimeloyl-ACP methyl ester carboxylesterase